MVSNRAQILPQLVETLGEPCAGPGEDRVVEGDDLLGHPDDIAMGQHHSFWSAGGSRHVDRLADPFRVQRCGSLLKGLF